ncbi:Flp pilus assembly protein CpaB [Caulobacter sp. S45]|uniref:Flp pilus assembly protein CpaB n=1 Tax=Caulobacter sp. S45 TaxID=1641861 RepID=UPI001575FFFA|nr:Flp pilus assembly protein CpaB [Caulobacter sp. S45]
MNTARMAILGVASLAGICCVGVLMHGLAGAKPPPAPIVVAPVAPPQPTVRVLVAKRDLPVGDRVEGVDMAWQTWPADGLNPAYVTDGAAAKAAASTQNQFKRAAGALTTVASDAISNPAEGKGAQFVGALVRERISANEPLMASKVVRAGASGVMAVTLDQGLRAVALPLTAENAAGGFILPGDHVDVLLTRQVDSGGVATASTTTHGFVTSTVMRNVRVLAIDQNMAAQKTASAVGATATVEATPKQAEYLVLAKASGTLTLALRSYADAAGGAEISANNHDTAGATIRVFRNSASTPVVPQ